ncbi:MAG: ATP-binding protein [Betaproteobacteria bacterium]|nr:ATP-binding protein [Betaproteobacteria bacterium]
MAIDRTDFESLGEGDLQELIASQVPEGLRVEYKRDQYGNTDAEKREVLKDVSAFANAHGGHLLIGIEARDAIPVALPGLAGLNADDAILRMEQLIRSGIEPRILGVRSKAVRLETGNTILVFRIPHS